MRNFSLACIFLWKTLVLIQSVSLVELLGYEDVNLPTPVVERRANSDTYKDAHAHTHEKLLLVSAVNQIH